MLMVVYLASPSFAAEITVHFTKQPNQPYLVSSQITVDSSEFSTVILNIKADKNSAATLMWANHYDPQFNQQKSISFDLQQGQKIYYINAQQRRPNRIAWIKGLLLYPENAQIEVIETKLTTGNLGTSFLSAWQEFFTFERPALRSVNFIYGPKINGQSVNLYIYFIILVFLILTFKLGPKKIILICLFFWCVLDLRAMLDQARTVKLDLAEFAGKSLDDKRAQTTLGDFYGFLKFAEAKLPYGAGFDLACPPNYYYLPKANYYLYPTHYDKNANYVLVYDPQNTLNYHKTGYKLFAAHKTGELILKQ